MEATKLEQQDKFQCQDLAPERSTRFMDSWKLWANETTIHGVKVILDNKESKLRRILRLIFVFGFLAGMTFISYQQIIRYLKYKTVTKESIIFEKQLDFPAVTICSHSFGRKAELLHPMDRVTMQYTFSWPRMQRPSLTTTRNVTLDAMVKGSLDESAMFYYCTFDRETFACSDLMKYRFTNIGVCYTFNSLEINSSFVTSTTGADNGLSLGISLYHKAFVVARDYSIGIKVLIHSRDEEPDMTQAITLGPGMVHYLSIKKYMYGYLPKPVTAFRTEECVETDSEDFSVPLLYHAKYSRHLCMEECLMLHVNATCHCIGPFFTGNTSLFKACGLVEYASCHENAIKNFSVNHSTTCDCPIPCHSVQYETKLSSAYFPNEEFLKNLYGITNTKDSIRQDFLGLRIYFDSKIIVVHEQVLEFGLADLIGSFGGYLGLAVGASLMTLLEILEQVIISILGLCKRKGDLDVTRKCIHSDK